MAWSLLGVVVIELLLLLESLISVIWRLLVKGIKNLHIFHLYNHPEIKVVTFIN